MYSLYYQPFACSFAIHTALEKISAPYELHRIDLIKQEQLEDGFLNINPLAQVPVLKYQDKTIRQAGAILLFLSEQHPEAKILPYVCSPDRSLALEMLFYLSNTVHPLFSRLFYPERFAANNMEEVKQIAFEKIQSTLVHFDHIFSQRNYTINNRLYATDYYLLAILNWLQLFQVDTMNLVHLRKYIQRVKKHSEVHAILNKEMQTLTT
jgi:glutathione S-transferase